MGWSDKGLQEIKKYIEGSSSANWWGLRRKEKKLLSKIKKMSLEFSESMYIEMEGFDGNRQIFSRAMDVVDSDRVAPSVPRQFICFPLIPRVYPVVGKRSLIGSATTASQSLTRTTPGDDTSRSTGRKRKAVDTDNLVDFVKDFN